MPVNKLISLVIAAVAALLVIYAGKSCAKDIDETNRKNAKNNTTSNTVDYNNNNAYTLDPAYKYADETVPTTEENYENVQTVTNLFGEIIGTIPAEENNSSNGNSAPQEITEPEPTRISILGNKDEEETTAAEATAPVTAPPTEAEKEINLSDDHPLLGDSADKKSEPKTDPPKEYPTDFVIHVN